MWKDNIVCTVVEGTNTLTTLSCTTTNTWAGSYTFTSGGRRTLSLVVKVNLGVVPDTWAEYKSYGRLVYGADPQINFVDTSVERTPGHPSIRSEAHSSADVNTWREVDGTWYSVKPGDHVVFKVWVKTSASLLNPDPSSTPGGRAGADYYGQTSAGYGILCTSSAIQSALGLPGWYGDAVGASPNGWWVPFGKDWTQIGWDVIIPSDTCSYISGGSSTIPCSPHQVDSFVMWLDVRAMNNPAKVWFADAELYINPPMVGT